MPLSLFLVLACNHPDPMDETLVPPFAEAAQPCELRYRGDVVGFARNSAVLPRLTDREKVALLVLANAECFTTDAVGGSGMLPPQARAFRDLLKEDRPEEPFRELAESSRSAAELYGLSGLYLLDRAAYEVLAGRLRGRGARVKTFIGCNESEEPVADVIGSGSANRWEIAGGVWPAALAGTR